MKIGDKIKFNSLNKWTDKDLVPDYLTESNGLPAEDIKHGSTELQKNKGTIIKKYKDDIYLIEFIDTYSQRVRLGFNKRYLTPLKPINIRELNKTLCDSK